MGAGSGDGDRRRCEASRVASTGSLSSRKRRVRPTSKATRRKAEKPRVAGLCLRSSRQE